ncbi:MAG: hypothetical protein HY512_01490 [Candidatus Aenigmarchaeota archaeon]|nr:hypothetical protein [Candidatus Aenigmarchaeota archaeon]
MPEKDSPKEGDLGQTEVDKVFVEHGVPVGGAPVDGSQPNPGSDIDVSDLKLNPEDAIQLQRVLAGHQSGAVPEPEASVVIGEGTPDESAQTEVDLTMADRVGSDVEELLAAEMSDDGYQGVDPAEVDEALRVAAEDPDFGVDPAQVDEAVRAATSANPEASVIFDDGEDSVGPDAHGAYEAGLGDGEAEEEQLEVEYTEADFRKTMAKKHGTRRLMAIFDSSIGERKAFYSGDDDPPCLQTGGQGSPNLELYLGHISVIGEDHGKYLIGADGKFKISLDGCTDTMPFRDLKNIRDSVGRLQRMFLTYHDLLDETPNFQGEETIFLDGSTCLVGEDPLETVYSELSDLPKNKLPGHEIVTLNNDKLTVEVYNPGSLRPLLEGTIERSGGIEISIGYSGYKPIAFATISRGLDTLERAYKAFIGLDISAKPGVGNS